ncbi:MAG: phosphotransferase family protein [Pseudomonadota bacterium]
MDEAAAAAWMARHVAGFAPPATFTAFSGGQSNPTFHVTSAGEAFVLRRKPAGALLASAHAIDREFRVQRALEETDVPVAKMRAYCSDPSVIGQEFYVMDHVAGRTFDDPRLPGLAPAARASLMVRVAETLAAIHRVDVAAVGLSDYGRPAGYLGRQLSRWTAQYRASETGPLPQMDALIAALAATLPKDSGRASLVHGDFRIDNLLLSANADGVLAVLDWELSTLGDPYADLAAVLMQWRLPAGTKGRGLAGVDRAALGLPADEAFVAAYEAVAGPVDRDALGVVVAFAFFKMAAILQGVKARGLAGNAANPARAAELGAMVPLYATLGLEAAAHQSVSRSGGIT